MLVDVDNRNEWKECFDVGGVKLPTGLYFGASAATGDLAGTEANLNIHNFMYLLGLLRFPYGILHHGMQQVKLFMRVLLIRLCV